MVKKWKFTPRTVAKTLGNGEEMRRTPTVNPSAKRNDPKPAGRSSSKKDRLGHKVVPMQERLGP